MKKNLRTIVYINAYEYAILNTLCENGEMKTKQMIEKINLGGFSNILKEPKKNSFYAAVHSMRAKGLISNSWGDKHQQINHPDIMREMLALINKEKGFGLAVRENTVLNLADEFLNKLSPDNSLVSGENCLVRDTLHGKHITYLANFPVEWLERYQTGQVWYNYKLTDGFFETVKTWREITRLYNSFE